MVKTEQIQIRTQGNCHVIDITEQVTAAVAKAGLQAGVVTVFNVGSTAGVTTTEYEPGLVNHDLKAAFERIAPEAGSMSTRTPGRTTTAIRTCGRRSWGLR